MSNVVPAERFEAHLARLRLETFCMNVMASYREQIVHPPLKGLIVMAAQPYGYMTRRVLGNWDLDVWPSG